METPPRHGQERLFWWVIGGLSLATLAGIVVVSSAGAGADAARGSDAAAGADAPPGAAPGAASSAGSRDGRGRRPGRDPRPSRGLRIARDGAGPGWRWQEVAPSGGAAGSRFSAPARRKRAQVFAQVSGDGAFVRLGEPEPGHWLWSFHEPGQTIDEYAEEAVNRRVPSRDTIHLQPFSDLRFLQAQVLGEVRQHTAIFFDCKVDVLPPRRIEAAWIDAGRRQVDAGAVVERLARDVRADSLGLFGLVGSDLSGLRLNFVFGLALLDRRAGVFSLHRYGTARPALTRRALKLSAHELGHIFGLRHCVFYRCLMNGTNSLAEMDGQPLHLCPVCLAKLRWNLGFDPARRYRALAAFYRRIGLEPEARFAAARAVEVGDR